MERHRFECGQWYAYADTFYTCTLKNMMVTSTQQEEALLCLLYLAEQQEEVMTQCVHLLNKNRTSACAVGVLIVWTVHMVTNSGLHANSGICAKILDRQNLKIMWNHMVPYRPIEQNHKLAFMQTCQSTVPAVLRVCILVGTDNVRT